MSYQARLRAYNLENYEVRVCAIVNLACFTRLTITGFLHSNPGNEKSVELCITVNKNNMYLCLRSRDLHMYLLHSVDEHIQGTAW